MACGVVGVGMDDARSGSLAGWLAGSLARLQIVTRS